MLQFIVIQTVKTYCDNVMFHLLCSTGPRFVVKSDIW